MIQNILLSGLSVLSVSMPAAVEAQSLYSTQVQSSINQRMRTQQMLQ
ncbi:hypothetical protein EV12_0769 [Prochlorococcus sp. MIT 0701]|nr:hypothetical protein EV12_0769 [Prochlorococcus sp. MIT 0701]